MVFSIASFSSGGYHARPWLSFFAAGEKGFSPFIVIE